jgi:hypothetical protein
MTKTSAMVNHGRRPVLVAAVALARLATKYAPPTGDVPTEEK